MNIRKFPRVVRGAFVLPLLATVLLTACGQPSTLGEVIPTGTEVQVTEPQGTWVFADLDARAELTQIEKANDSYGRNDFVRRGRGFTVADGTNLLVIDDGDIQTRFATRVTGYLHEKVRVLSGPQAGRAGWVSVEFVERTQSYTNNNAQTAPTPVPTPAPRAAGDFPPPGERVEMIIQDLTGTLDDATVVLAEKNGTRTVSLHVSKFGAQAIARQRGPMHLQYDSKPGQNDGVLDAPPVPVNGAVVDAFTNQAWLTGASGELVPSEVGGAIALTAWKNLPLFVEGR
jgi:hypothetical protein